MPHKDPIKRKEYKHKWYLENKEDHNKKSKKYYEENKEAVLAMCKDYVERNKEKTKKYQKEYRDEHKEESKKYSKEYRNSPAPITLMDKLVPCEEVRKDPDNPELLQVRCYNSKCQKWFNPTIEEVWRRHKVIMGMTSGGCNFYCSEECKKSCAVFHQRTHQKGVNPNPNSREVQPELRKLVLERDEHTCQNICCPNHNDPNVKLVCHHIKPINESPIESADMDICITLCEECHKMVHRLPGCTYYELRC